MQKNAADNKLEFKSYLISELEKEKRLLIKDKEDL